MFYLHQDEIGRLFIQNDNYGNFKPIYSSAPKIGINQLKDEIYDFVKNNNINLTNPINTYLVAYYWKE